MAIFGISPEELSQIRDNSAKNLELNLNETFSRVNENENFVGVNAFPVGHCLTLFIMS